MFKTVCVLRLSWLTSQVMTGVWRAYTCLCFHQTGWRHHQTSAAALSALPSAPARWGNHQGWQRVQWTVAGLGQPPWGSEVVQYQSHPLGKTPPGVIPANFPCIFLRHNVRWKEAVLQISYIWELWDISWSKITPRFFMTVLDTWVKPSWVATELDGLFQPCFRVKYNFGFI